MSLNNADCVRCGEGYHKLISDPKTCPKRTLDLALAEIDRLTKDVERLWGLLSAGNEIDIQRVNEIESLKEKVARYEEVLSFYGDEENYKMWEWRPGQALSDVRMDGGQRARAARQGQG